jgi:tripartite-type tricarboxylate transporter receptor subunit TctC
MHTHRPWLLIASLCLLPMLGAAATPVQAQDYPARPVRIITDSAPGSAIDVILRIIGDRLSQVWGQQVVPINQPGGGGAIAARAAAAAAPDGYTLSIPALSAFVAPPGAAPISRSNCREILRRSAISAAPPCSSRPLLRST